MSARASVLTLLVAAAGCGASSSLATPAASPTVIVTRVGDVAVVPDAVATRDVVVTERTTARLMRVPPAGIIAEHHHPHFEEVFFVHTGSIVLVLDGVEHALDSGAAVFIPAGTVIAGRNPAGTEAVLLVTWSRVSDGPLTLPGRAH